jgi:hypothetical protein
MMCRRPRSIVTTSRDWVIAAGLGAACLALYIATLCPTVFWYDSAEYTAAAYTLGIPHPPGYPLYTIIGWLITRLPVDPAYAMNLMSAVFGAVAVTLAFIVQRELGARAVAAVVGAGTLGLGRLFWSQCVIAEVYTPAIAMLLIVLLLLLRGARRGRVVAMALAAFLAGLGLGLHLYIATCGLGFVVLVLGVGLEVQRPAALRQLLGRVALGRRVTCVALCLGAALLGAAIFVYIPLRAAMRPEMNFEDPSTWERFAWFVTGGNYKHWWLQSYSLGERMREVLSIFYDQLLVVGALLATVGLVHLWRTRALAALALTLAVAGNVTFFFNYRVHDLAVFFLPSVVVLCLLVGIGTEAIGGGVESLLVGGRRWLARIAIPALCLFPLSLAAANFNAVSLRGYTEAREYGEQLCAQLPRGAVILTFTTPPEWKNDAVFAHYFQKVLRRRRDVTVRGHVTPVVVMDLLRRGVPTYLYHPVPRVTRVFTLAKEGAIYRIQGPR